MSVPRLSVMLFPFHAQMAKGDLLPVDLVENLHKAGVRALEPMILWGESNPQRWEELRGSAADLGVGWSCLDIGVDFTSGGESERRAGLDVVARGVELCRELECPTALVVGSRPVEGLPNSEARKILSEWLAKAAAAAEGSGVTLNIEDFGVYPDFTASAGHVMDVVQGTGRSDVKVTFDNGNFLFADEQPTDCYRLVKERLIHVHIKDFAVGAPEGTGGLKSRAGTRYVGCRIGSGVAQVRECLSVLKADGYSGWLSLEVGMAPPLEDALIGAKVVTEAWQEV